jgi:hypothetical protein
MSRICYVTFDNQSVSAAVDLFEILAGTGKPFVVHRVTISQSSDYGDSQAEGLRILIRRATSGYTSGSGGTTPTVGKASVNDSNHGMTVEACNTTAAVAGTGSLTTLVADAFNVQAGFDWFPTPEMRPLLLPGEALIVNLPTTPTDALSMSGTVVVEEL